MRSVNRGPSRSDDSGAILILVALLMTVLIGFAALAIDTAALRQERRELQNGADAAALAVAKDCAAGDCLDEAATANIYADLNASDNAANIGVVCGVGPGLPACSTSPGGITGATGWAFVQTTTHNPANSGNSAEVDFVFAPVINGGQGGTVQATATAAWGPIGRAATLPLIFSSCEFAEAGGSINPAVVPSGEIYIYFHNTVQAGNCPAGPAGGDSPISGGFGWLGASANCQVTISSGGWISDKPGNGVPNSCDPNLWRGLEVLMPIYDGTNGLTGNNGQYHVAGFVGFVITGYRFSGNTWPNGFQCPEDNGNSGRCIRGHFTRVTSTGDFGGVDYGSLVIKMVG